MHIGKRIKEVMQQQGISVIQLAQAVNCERANIYSIFKRENLDTNVLIKISKALNHDFFADISEEIFINSPTKQAISYTADFSYRL